MSYTSTLTIHAYCSSTGIRNLNDQLNENFAHLCDWFVNNKLSIHFGEDKTKCILFASKNKIKKNRQINNIIQ